MSEPIGLPDRDNVSGMKPTLLRFMPVAIAALLAFVACATGGRPSCPKGQDPYLCTVLWWAPGVVPALDNCLTRNSRWFCSASKAGALLLVEKGLIAAIQANPKLNELQVTYGCIDDGAPSQKPNDVAPDPTFKPLDGPSLPGWDTYGSNACGTAIPTDGQLGPSDAGAGSSACATAAAALAATAGAPITADACGECFIEKCCVAYVASTEQAQATQELSCIAQTGLPCAGTVVLPGDSTFVGCMNVYCGSPCAP